MGNSKSKIKTGPRRKLYRKSGGKGEPVGTGSHATVCDDTELLLLRRTIERNPEIFVLNNLMMCVQFFGNYEEEIKHVKETLASTRETELNSRLPPQKHVLLPDVLQEHVARNVGFTSSRQTFRPTIEPLQPVRIYTVHDNVDIVEPNDSSHYSSLNDSSVYNILLKPTEHRGYVQLQLDNGFRTPRVPTKEEDMDLSSIAENDDELYSDGDSVYGPRPPSSCAWPRKSRHGHAGSLPNLRENVEAENREVLTRSCRDLKAETDYDGSSSEERRLRGKRCRAEPPERETRRADKQSSRSKARGPASQDQTSSNSSGYRSDNYAMDSDSSCNPGQSSRYSASSAYDELEERWISSGDFPDRCFKRVTYTGDGRLYDPREDKMRLLNSKQRRIKLALTRHNYTLVYVSSTEFMKHFIRLFVNRLAESLGFDEECVENRRREGCVLYCDKIMVSGAFRHSRMEQYEIVPAIWLQWPSCAQEWLDRPRSTWPDYDDVQKIRDSGCYVVPEGFVPKRGSSNLIEDLEWQLTFPTAERYLETCMTQAQAQVYLIALMLHKTFMRPIFDTMFGLTAAHIRHKMFWTIEENDRPSKWPDNRTGECLLTFLESLYRNISLNDPHLKDYFVKDRNLFQRIPSEHLLHTQKQLKRITENPVMYVFHAMENIRYSDNFFPRLDFEMLLRILTVDTLTLVNPALAQRLRGPATADDYAQRDEKYDRTEFWDMVKNRRNQRAVHVVTNRTLINPRKATDAIIEISTRCAEMDGPRLCALLDFFVRHFVKTAERCNQYQAHRQKTVYLDHADRLSILLSEHYRYKDDALAYRDKIELLRRKPSGPRSKEEPPQTPERNAALYNVSVNDRSIPNSSDDGDPGNGGLDREDRTRDVARAVVHEGHYEQPDEEKPDQHRLAVSFDDSVETGKESTYI